MNNKAEATLKKCKERFKVRTKIIVGCNYHTTWQRQKGMRFVLRKIEGDKAQLVTRRTKKCFWVDVKDLIFIESKHNYRKALKRVIDEVFINGAVRSQDLRFLTEQGVEVIQHLSKTTGIAEPTEVYKAVEDGQVTYEHIKDIDLKN